MSLAQIDMITYHIEMAQNEDIPDEDDAELREDWEKRVATGQPMIIYEFDRLLLLNLRSSGELDADCACLHVGNFETAGVVRVRLSPMAVRQLMILVRRLASLEDFDGPYLH